MQNAYLSKHSEQLYGHCGWWRLTGCKSKLSETLESTAKDTVKALGAWAGQQKGQDG